MLKHWFHVCVLPLPHSIARHYITHINLGRRKLSDWHTDTQTHTEKVSTFVIQNYFLLKVLFSSSSTSFFFFLFLDSLIPLLLSCAGEKSKHEINKRIERKERKSYIYNCEKSRETIQPIKLHFSFLFNFEYCVARNDTTKTTTIFCFDQILFSCHNKFENLMLDLS